MRQPKAGTCSSTPGRVRAVVCPADCWGLLIEQAGATSGTLYASAASGYTDEAASPTLIASSDAYTILPTGTFTVYLGPPTGAIGATRSVYIGSDTASATFIASPLGIEVMR